MAPPSIFPLSVLAQFLRCCWQYRSAVIERFGVQTDGKLRRQDVKSTIDATFGQSFEATQADWYPVVMNELATLVRGVWQLKTGEYE
jgi:hypothetical protein